MIIPQSRRSQKPTYILHVNRKKKLYNLVTVIHPSDISKFNMSINYSAGWFGKIEHTGYPAGYWIYRKAGYPVSGQITIRCFPTKVCSTILQTLVYILKRIGELLLNNQKVYLKSCSSDLIGEKRQRYILKVY